MVRCMWTWNTKGLRENWRKLYTVCWTKKVTSAFCCLTHTMLQFSSLVFHYHMNLESCSNHCPSRYKEAFEWDSFALWYYKSLFFSGTDKVFSPCTSPFLSKSKMKIIKTARLKNMYVHSLNIVQHKLQQLLSMLLKAVIIWLDLITDL